MKKIQNKRKQGFTLVELLAIMVIIAIITAIGVPVYQSSSMKTKEKTFRIKLDTANQSGRLWALDNLDCFKTDTCEDLITPVECVQGGGGKNDDCYVMSLGTLASEGYYDYDDNEGNILNPIDNSSMKDEQIMLVYNSKYGKVSDVPLNTYVYKILTFTPSAQRTQNHTVNISNLYDIASITSNNGTVTYEKNKNNINITLKNGDSVGTEWNPKLHSKSVTANRTSSNNSFDSTYSYDDGEYSGTINKDGTAAVISGSYTPSDTKYVSGQTSSNYNSGGYVGTLSSYLYSGSYTPSDTKYVSGQTSSYYNSGGYSGTLSSYLYSGSYTPSDSKYVTDQSSSNYNSGGYSGTLSKYVASGSYTAGASKTVSKEGSRYSIVVTKDGSRVCSGSHPSSSSSISYSSGGYSGKLYYSSSSIFDGPIQDPKATGAKSCAWTTIYIPKYSGTVSKPAVDTRVYKYQGTVTKPAVDTRVYKYQGNVTKPAVDTRVYKYQGTVTKPAVDTRVYRYQGNVTKPAVDTRVWQQDYRGTAYKGGDQDLYSYEVTIAYSLK